MGNGIKEIPIEERDAEELTHIRGINAHNELHTVRVTPEHSPVANHAFDVTPARMITGILTEFGLFETQSLPNLKEQLPHV